MKSKLLMLAIALISVFTLPAKAQTAIDPDNPNTTWSRFAINIYGGYTFKDGLHYNNATGSVKDNAHWGGSFEYFIKQYLSAELMYQRIDTKVPVYADFNGQQINPDHEKLGENFIMLGINGYYPTHHVYPYFGLDAGINVLTNKAQYTVTRFAFGGKAGVMFKINKNIGFKLGAQLYTTIDALDKTGQFYVNPIIPMPTVLPGGPTTIDLGEKKSFVQFGFTGGLIFGF